MNGNAIKVCHLTVLHRLDDARVYYKECRSLAHNGFDVTLVGFEDVAYDLVKDGVRVISLCQPAKNRIEVIRTRTKLAYQKALELDADIYHFHEPELLGVGLKLKRKGKKVVFDSHEFYGYQLYYGVHKPKVVAVPPALMRLFAKLFMRYEARVCRRLDAVVEVCTVEGSDYFEGRAKRVCFIRNTPVLDAEKNFDAQTEVARCQEPSVSYIGSLTHDRGVTSLVEACDKAGVSLILAGNFNPKSYGERLRAMPAFQCVDYRGFLNREGMDEAMKQSFAGVSNILCVGQYHKIDTFPTKVLDYMRMGLPVIISNTRFHLEMNEKYHFGICVNPADSDEIAAALTYLFQHPEEASAMGRNGKQLVETAWNWAVDESRLLDLYRTILE